MMHWCPIFMRHGRRRRRRGPVTSALRLLVPGRVVLCAFLSHGHYAITDVFRRQRILRAAVVSRLLLPSLLPVVAVIASAAGFATLLATVLRASTTSTTSTTASMTVVCLLWLTAFLSGHRLTTLGSGSLLLLLLWLRGTRRTASLILTSG